MTRPWGTYSVLYDIDCKIKRLVVLPGMRTSLQSHRKRAETWVVISGKGNAIVDDTFHFLERGSVVQVDKSSVHRIENAGDENLVLIEVQTGEYFGEDDIIRIEDDYGRVGAR
jgi:mannose-6-phosphate isomerase-like protein (cupin superfamily)